MSFLKKIKKYLFKSEFENIFSKYSVIPRYTPCTINFKEFTIKTPDSLSVLWQIKEIFFDKEFLFENHNNEDLLIYDCGANVGLATLFFEKMYDNAKIKSFEADPSIFLYLKENVNNNQLKNVELFNNAVWINNEDVYFSQEGSDGGSIYGSENSKIKVNGLRLRDLIEKEIKIDLLKIDIEGAEADVLIDCNEMLQKVKYLFVEYHSFLKSKQRLDELLKILSLNGFRYTIHDIKKKKTPFLSQEENLNFDLQLNIYAINTTY